MEDSNQSSIAENAYKIEMNRTCSVLLELILISIMTSIIPLLLSTDGSAVFYTSTSFYITIVLSLAYLMYYRFLGIIISFMVFVICGVINQLPSYLLIANSLVNLLQACLMLLSYLFLRKIRSINKNRYSVGVFYLSKYNFLMIIFGIVYSIYSLFYFIDIYVIALFSLIILFVSVLKSVLKKDFYLFLYIFLIALLPSLISSVISAFVSYVPQEIKWNYIFTWSLSNFILLQTFGYILFQILFLKESKTLMKDRIIKIGTSAVSYYISLLIWNILIIYLYKINIINVHLYVYFFPWALGNILFGFNLYFSFFNDIEVIKNKFSWFENRVVVVEKNTSAIITIIAFLLPFSTSFMKGVPKELLSLFIANIFCACLSIGLIWVPSTNVKFIALLKSIKTIFYLYSICLLLVSSMIIVFHNN